MMAPCVHIRSGVSNVVYGVVFFKRKGLQVLGKKSIVSTVITESLADVTVFTLVCV